MSSLLEPLD